MAVKDDYQDFKNALNELKINSKPIINFLTILAEEKLNNAQQIVRAIEERILEAKGDGVLPVLYVLDSIVKNLRSSTYIQLFENNLPGLFAGAFNKVDERTRSAMFKLRQTWPPYFANSVLYNLDTRTHYIDPAWPITARVPDVPASALSIHINPNFMQRNNSSSTLSTSQQKASVKQEDNDRTVKNTDLPTKDDTYQMIPIDRKEIKRQDIDSISNKEITNDQHSNKKLCNNRTEHVGNSVINTNQDSSFTEMNNEKSTVNKDLQTTTEPTKDEEEELFCGTDIDYRETDVPVQQKQTTNNLDTDRLYKLNSECLSLAEQKYKSKELSSEEYQATLKLLQNILQNEVQRLTTSTTTNSSLINNNTQATSSSSSSSLTTTATTALSNPFQQPQQTIPFPTPHLPAQPTTTATSLPAFPFTGFANDTHRHALQILAAVGASLPYTSHNNFLPYIPPLPPAPPPFTILSNTFPSTTTPTASGRTSPSVKRPHDENNNSNKHSDEDNKRARYDTTTTTVMSRTTALHNFDDENIAPVPSLIDANINTLKKKYTGVIQQLYIGKYQCRVCGLRFSAKQKHLYTHHLDWHYWENRQATASSALLERCRDWYPSLQEWTIYEENLDQQMKNNQALSTQNRQAKDIDKSLLTNEPVFCSAKGSGNMDDDRCYVCQDPFENFFDDNREEWCLKDAIRVDERTYHPICYQDVQYQEPDSKMMTLSVNNDQSNYPVTITDETSNQSSDSHTVDNAMASVNIKSGYEEIVEKESSSETEDDNIDDESMKPKYLSSMSFVNLVETMFVKKEDLKPIENLESVTINNTHEELSDSATITEEIPFLSIKPENDCEFLMNKTSDGFGTISD